VERDLKDPPIWAIEGIPTFFEKFYGYYQDLPLRLAEIKKTRSFRFVPWCFAG